MTAPRILICGDSIIDRLLTVSLRLNPEAPGVVYSVEHTEDRPGGAAAVAMICESLGANVELVHGDKRCLKHRMVCEGRLLYDRIDFDVQSRPIDTNAIVFRDPQAVIVSDYGKGAVGDDMVPRLRRALPNVPIIVDPARGRDWKIYQGASIIKANRSEAAEPLSDFAVAPTTIVTLGADGIDLHTEGKRLGIPTWVSTNGRVPIDPTGAGDTVAATIAVCLARGFDLRRACELANTAAGFQCQRIGVSAVYWQELGAEASLAPFAPT